MAAESKSFPELIAQQAAPLGRTSRRVLWMQTGLVYSLIVSASWTPEGPAKVALMTGAAALIIMFAAGSRFTAREMGLGIPSLRGSFAIVGLGILLAASIPLIAAATGLRFPPMREVPWRGARQYVVWALMQQFALQAFFYLRMESLLGSRRAILPTALLFSIIHIPSPVLMIATLFGGLFFCEMFRRYRTILPLGVVHALLGLTVAASFSDHLLHHMRVGIGYLPFHH